MARTPKPAEKTESEAPASSTAPTGLPEGVDSSDPYLRETWSNPDPTQLSSESKE
jgi:hypothetical protein